MCVAANKYKLDKADCEFFQQAFIIIIGLIFEQAIVTVNPDNPAMFYDKNREHNLATNLYQVSYITGLLFHFCNSILHYRLLVFMFKISLKEHYITMGIAHMNFRIFAMGWGS